MHTFRGIGDYDQKSIYIYNQKSHWLMASSLASLHVVAVVIKIFVSSIVALLLLLLKSKSLPAHGAGAVPEESEEFKRSASQIMRSFQP